MLKNKCHSPDPVTVLLYNLNHIFEFIDSLYEEFPQSNHSLTSFYNSSSYIIDLKRKKEKCHELLSDEVTEESLSYIFKTE